MKNIVKMSIFIIAAFILSTGLTYGIKAQAAENHLVGLSSDYLRLYINAENELSVISEEFVDDNETTLFSIDGKTQLLSQFAIAAINSYANIRKGPSTSYDIVGRLYPGALATAISSEDGWTKIVSKDVEGYILSDFLLFGQEAVDYADEYYKNHYQVVSNTLNLRESASTSSTIKAQLTNGANLLVLEKGDEWYKVTWQGSASSVTGYVHTAYIGNDFKYAITADEAKELDSKNSYQLANMIWPMPADHKIHTYFGWRVPPCPGASSYHKGLDIGGPYGASIVSVLSGTVELVSYDSSSGNYVVVNHGNGVKTKYLHCSSILVKTGQTVTQGETIAKCGATGVATGSHLHFSLLINNAFVDPYPYLKNVH